MDGRVNEQVEVEGKLRRKGFCSSIFLMCYSFRDCEKHKLSFQATSDVTM